MESNRNLGRAIIGIVLILIGVAFIGKTLDFFPHHIMRHVFTWEMILIVLGIIFISTRDNKTTGWILLVIGVVFWVPDFVHIPFGVRRLIWPALLIIVGLVIIIRSSAGRRHFPKTESSNEYIDDIAIFGGGDKVITSASFKGGNITAVFGGSKIDLTQAQLAPGKNIVDVFCLFGGTTIIVPENWNVKVDVISVFGGFSDKRYVKQDTAMDVGKEIVIKGFAMFGGGEVKS